jgi:hypothetical protein
MTWWSSARAPAGEAAASLGGNLGYSVALVERDTVGGTVVTSGGAPTKTFREAAVYLSSFEKEKIYGVALSAPPEVMYPAIRARAQEVSERLRQATLERIRERGVHLMHGEGRLEADHTVVARGGDGTETRLHAGATGPQRTVRRRRDPPEWPLTASSRSPGIIRGRKTLFARPGALSGGDRASTSELRHAPRTGS